MTEQSDQPLSNWLPGCDGSRDALDVGQKPELTFLNIPTLMVQLVEILKIAFARLLH